MLQHEFLEIDIRDFPVVMEAKSIDEIIRRYPTVIVPDKIIINNKTFLSGFPCDWNQIGNVRAGLNYEGISIIHTTNLKEFLKRIKKSKKNNSIKKLIALINDAQKNNNIIVHFGI